MAVNNESIISQPQGSTIIPDWPGCGSLPLLVPFQTENTKQLEFRALKREFRENTGVPNLAALNLF